jgi:hypothetical protein
MKDWTNQEIGAAYQKMRAKAVKDPEFRKRLVADPKKAIEEFTGKALPPSAKVKVIEVDPSYQATFILPPLMKSDEIGDKELESVAGGACVADHNCGAQGCAGYQEK